MPFVLHNHPKYSSGFCIIIFWGIYLRYLVFFFYYKVTAFSTFAELLFALHKADSRPTVTKAVWNAKDARVRGGGVAIAIFHSIRN